MIGIWIAFGTEKDLHYFPVYDISASLSPRKSLAVLLVFQAFIGCDTVSHFLKVVRTLLGKCARHTTPLLQLSTNLTVLPSGGNNS